MEAREIEEEEDISRFGENGMLDKTAGKVGPLPHQTTTMKTICAAEQTIRAHLSTACAIGV